MPTKFIFGLLFLFFYQQSFGNNENIIPTRYFDLIHTDLDLKPIWETHQMKGKAVLKLKPYYKPQRYLSLDANHLDIHNINMLSENTHPLTYRTEKAKLIIDLGKEYTAQDSFIISIEYTANPDSIVDSTGKAIKDAKGLYFINTDGKRENVPMHLWTQGETHSNSSWFPTIDLPSEKQTQTLTITYPKEMVSLSNGKLISSKINEDGTKTDFWSQETPHSVYLTVLVVGDYKIVKDEWRGKEVSYYMESQYESSARSIFGRTPEMMEYFSKLLGVDFPWDKYSQVIVHDFTAGAMENTTAVTFNNFVQKDARELYDENDDETVAHELFHHWFGDLATCESWTHLTLNESFANYSEYLWTEYKYGKNEAEYHWYKDLTPYFSNATIKREPLIRYNYNHPDDMFDVISYNKGGKILHMLRVYLGDETFFKSLKFYLNKYAYKTAEYSNLRQCFEEVSGEDLSWFFRQWYEMGGHPTLYSNYIKGKDSSIFILKQKHNFDSTFIYRIPLNVDIYTNSGTIRKRIVLDKESDTFIFYEKDIQAISTDGSNSLVGKINESKEVEDLVFILQHANSYLTQSKALKKLNIYKNNAKVKDAFYLQLSSSNLRLVKEVIRFIDKKWLKKEDRWNEKLIELAENGKFGYLRAAAIEKISENNSVKEYEELATKKLQDSSYLVENTALSLLNQIDQDKAYELAKQRLNSTSFAILNTAYELIAKKGSPTDEKAFEEGIQKINGYKKIAVYMNYGIYLANQSEEKIESSMSKFKTMLDSNDEINRYSASSALKMMKNELVKLGGKSSKKYIDTINSILSRANMSEVVEQE